MRCQLADVNAVPDVTYYVVQCLIRIRAHKMWATNQFQVSFRLIFSNKIQKLLLLYVTGPEIILVLRVKDILR
jgi:hypothetical protein